MNEQHFDALPPLQVDRQPAAPAPERSVEAAPVQGDQPSAPAPAAVTPAAQPLTADDITMPPASLAPIIADDVDLIEKEWVEKAKQIVEQTKDDPYQQTKAITEVKADYIKKRYNRDLKTSEAA